MWYNSRNKSERKKMTDETREAALQVLGSIQTTCEDDLACGDLDKAWEFTDEVDTHLGDWFPPELADAAYQVIWDHCHDNYSTRSRSRYLRSVLGMVKRAQKKIGG